MPQYGHGRLGREDLLSGCLELVILFWFLWSDFCRSKVSISSPEASSNSLEDSWSNCVRCGGMYSCSLSLLTTKDAQS